MHMYTGYIRPAEGGERNRVTQPSKLRIQNQRQWFDAPHTMAPHNYDGHGRFFEAWSDSVCHTDQSLPFVKLFSAQTINCIINYCVFV